MIHWPIHDYGPLVWDFSVRLPYVGTTGYNEAMFDDWLLHTYKMNTEFITGMQLEERIRSYLDIELSVEEVENGTIIEEMIN